MKFNKISSHLFEVCLCVCMNIIKDIYLFNLKNTYIYSYKEKKKIRVNEKKFIFQCV